MCPTLKLKSTHEAGQCLLIANTPRGATAQEHPVSLIEIGLLWKGVKLGLNLPLKDLEGRVREQPRGLLMGKSTRHLCSPSPAPLPPLTKLRPCFGASPESTTHQVLLWLPSMRTNAFLPALPASCTLFDFPGLSQDWE